MVISGPQLVCLYSLALYLCQNQGLLYSGNPWSNVFPYVYFMSENFKIYGPIKLLLLFSYISKEEQMQ